MGVVKLLSAASSSPQLGTDSQSPLMVGRLIEGTAVLVPGLTKDSSSSSHSFQKRLMARQRGGNISSCNNSSCHPPARQEGLGSLLRAPGSVRDGSKQGAWVRPAKIRYSVCFAWSNCFCGLEYAEPSWK